MSDAYTTDPTKMYAHCGHKAYEWRCPICVMRAQELKRLFLQAEQDRQRFIQSPRGTFEPSNPKE